jgi:hypothetical protein
MKKRTPHLPTFGDQAPPYWLFTCKIEADISYDHNTGFLHHDPPPPRRHSGGEAAGGTSCPPQPHAIFGRHRHAGVQRKALHLRAETAVIRGVLEGVLVPPSPRHGQREE